MRLHMFPEDQVHEKFETTACTQALTQCILSNFNYSIVFFQFFRKSTESIAFLSGLYIVRLGPVIWTKLFTELHWSSKIFRKMFQTDFKSISRGIYLCVKLKLVSFGPKVMFDFMSQLFKPGNPPESQLLPLITFQYHIDYYWQQ